MLFVADAGCRQGTEPPETASIRAALSANAPEVLGFERAADWHVISGQNIALTSSAVHSQGATSLAVKAKNYVAIQSDPISVTSALAAPVSYDLSLPPTNASWAGATQLYVDCHSRSIFNQFLGQKELTGQAAGSFITMSYQLPAALQGHGCQDLTFTVVLNVPSDATGMYLLDDLQLGGPPTLTSCLQTPANVDAGAVAGVTASVALSRPSVGSVTLDWTFVPDGTSTSSTVAVNLNGAPLLRTTSGLGRSTTQTVVSYFPPFAGVHTTTTTSDGQTMVINVDGRTTLPALVGADPSAIRFADGAPPPQLTISAAIRDAVAALLNAAPATTAGCFAQLGVQSNLTAAVMTAPNVVFGTGFDPGPCMTCERNCNLAYFGCDAVATGACILTGGWGCAGAVTTCVARQFMCITGCHSSGTDCCPVGCGDSGEYSQPTCCGKGDTCLNTHGNLCCAPNSTACGGEACCNLDQRCVSKTGQLPPNDPPAFCCGGPGETACGNVCCRGGQKCFPTGATGCCDACGSNADCSSAEACVDGCCVAH